MGIKLHDIRDFIVIPTNKRLGLHSDSAEVLVMGTGLCESGYSYLDQTTPGAGPAYGLWQMEEATHTDLWINYLPGQPSALRDELLSIAGVRTKYLSPPISLLHGNLFYAAAMCRVHYKRVRAPLPAANDAEGMAAYWKQFYNTAAGKGTIAKAIPLFKQVVKS